MTAAVDDGPHSYHLASNTIFIKIQNWNQGQGQGQRLPAMAMTKDQGDWRPRKKITRIKNHNQARSARRNRKNLSLNLKNLVS